MSMLLVSSVPSGICHLDLKKETEAFKNELLESEYDKCLNYESVNRGSYVNIINSEIMLKKKFHNNIPKPECVICHISGRKNFLSLILIEKCF